MPTIKERFIVYMSNKFLKNVYLIVSKLITVLFSALIILGTFTFFGWEFTFYNYLGSLCLYFVLEEIRTYSINRRIIRK